MKTQKEKGRKLYVVTTAGIGSQTQLNRAGIYYLFNGYFGREMLDSRAGLYRNVDGEIRRISDDYDTREIEQWRISQKKNIPFDKWDRVIGIQTRTSFDPNTIYRKPTSERTYMKDLSIARKLVDPENYMNLRIVMVGDGGDVEFLETCSEIPLICVSGNRMDKSMISGISEWGGVEKMLDNMFLDNRMPYKIYDEMFSKLVFGEYNRYYFSLGRLKYELKKGENSERVVFCK
ncbi:MAG: hypothetical protein V1870_04920 [Candidatus Aenigmatarchaeota archaeon]